MAMMHGHWDAVRKIAVSAAIGTLGGGVFTALGLPAGWLSGAMVFVALATLGGVPTGIPNSVRNGIFVLLGLTMGAGVQPDFLQQVMHWPLSIAILAITVVGITAASFAVLRYLGGWSKDSAFYGAIPGALSFVLALASERGVDLARIATTQTIRLLILVAVLPTLVAGTTELSAEAGLAVPTSSPEHLMLGLVLCALGGYLANRAGIPAGWMVGSFLVSLVGNASGYLPLSLSGNAQIPAFVLLGAMIGSRFENITLRDLVQLSKISLAAFLAGTTVAVAGASITTYWLDVPFGQALLAYAPGGLEVMTLLSFMLELDPVYVAVHQIFRFVTMILLLPWVTIIVLGRKQSDPIL
ncbi:AbrB family transcriptional regulator [Roseibium sediminis]|uniref:AbrB family transcriptional regulator n=1 Tax=Roseibium sediminis TaxID=1775174 RepID=UPI001AD915CA|nr:AbrB family transcriptional regulator [Roseibium sediminis]